MLNPDLPHRNPLVGPPAAVPVDFPVDVVERFADALRKWACAELPRPTQPDQEV
ncbi:hypothetical protein [Nocardia sp. NPDC004604]|uniref:hypothetical protein n=1 Tax=Nocardia sp. NPDC004604 TaxID=3157013 RepID=UPI0033B290E4